MQLGDLNGGKCVFKGTENRSKDDFMKMVTASTGITEDQLNKMDLGEIEEKLGIKAAEPFRSLSMKKGKSTNGLYKFYDSESKTNLRRHITDLISPK